MTTFLQARQNLADAAVAWALSKSMTNRLRLLTAAEEYTAASLRTGLGAADRQEGKKPHVFEPFFAQAERCHDCNESRDHENHRRTK